MKSFPQTHPSRELESLARTFNMHDVLVSVRCFQVEHPIRHFEIVLSGRGQAAIVDIAAHEESGLAERIEQSVACFSAALQLQHQKSF